MEALKLHHEDIRTLASRELLKYGIDVKLKKLPTKTPSPKDKCFGVPINKMKMVEVTFDKFERVPVPKLFINLCKFIRASEMKDDGMFRKECAKEKEKNIIKVLDEGNPIPLETTIIEASFVLKVFLKNIPGHLIPTEHVGPFVQASKLENNSEVAIHLAVLLMPLEHIYLFAYLMQFFNEVTANSAKNKMDSYNLAVVLAPDIFPMKLQTSLEQQWDMSTTKLKLAKIMIEKPKLLGVVLDALIQKLDALHDEQNAGKKKTTCCWCFEI